MQYNHIKSFSILLFLSTAFLLNAQRVIPPTDSLHIIGQVKMPVHYSLSDLDHFPKTKLPDQLIYNQKGEIKDTLTKLEGVALKTILEKVEFQVEKPKELNEFYFVFIASDGYKVVFSWNEIYNTAVGDQCYVVTSSEGKALAQMEDRILFISSADIKTGRRHIKGLHRIEVKRVE